MNLFTIVEFIFISLVFHRAFGSVALKKGIMVALAVFTAFAVANLLWMQGPGQFNSWTMGLECLLLMGVVLLFLFEVFRQEKVARLERYPMFWVASGALLYVGCSLFLFIFINYVLAESNSVAYAEWGIHSSVNIAANLCYATGLWLSPGK